MEAQLTSSRDGGGAALDLVTSALGVEGDDFSRLNFKLQGQRASIALKQDSKSRQPLGLRLSVAFEGPARASGEDDDAAPSILLRRETELDVGDKARDLHARVVEYAHPGALGFTWRTVEHAGR